MGFFLQLKCKAQPRLLQVREQEIKGMQAASGQSCCYATEDFDSQVQRPTKLK